MTTTSSPWIFTSEEVIVRDTQDIEESILVGAKRQNHAIEKPEEEKSIVIEGGERRKKRNMLRNDSVMPKGRRKQ